LIPLHSFALSDISADSKLPRTDHEGTTLGALCELKGIGKNTIGGVIEFRQQDKHVSPFCWNFYILNNNNNNNNNHPIVKVNVRLQITNPPEGSHGFHIHEVNALLLQKGALANNYSFPFSFSSLVMFQTLRKD
jgi:hypothetical protein